MMHFDYSQPEKVSISMISLKNNVNNIFRWNTLNDSNTCSRILGASEIHIRNKVVTRRRMIPHLMVKTNIWHQILLMVRKRLIAKEMLIHTCFPLMSWFVWQILNVVLYTKKSLSLIVVVCNEKQQCTKRGNQNK